jgi:flagellum-specific ATP synthase
MTRIKNLTDIENIDSSSLSIPYGYVSKITPTNIIISGLDVSIGDIVQIEINATNTKIKTFLYAMINILEANEAIAVPFSFLDGLKINNRVFKKSGGISIKCGYGFLGRIVNAFGEPIDKLGAIKDLDYLSDINKKAMSPLERKIINTKAPTGVKAIDTMLTCGKGQKVGIFAGSGVGKSSLLGMITRGSSAKIKIIALIGERGREIPEFIQYSLNNNLSNTVIVAVTSDESALMRKYGAYCATSIAEYFRDLGEDVLLIMDSITRFAMAGREIGLSLGETPGRGGYPASVYAALPQIMERSGANAKGCISAFFTILVDGDDISDDPIADQARSILDGHIILSRQLASEGFYPPIDILNSASRVISSVITKEHYKQHLKIKKTLSLIKENDILIKVGSYVTGANKELDDAMNLKNALEEFFTQDLSNILSFDDIINKFMEITNDNRPLS